MERCFTLTGFRRTEATDEETATGRKRKQKIQDKSKKLQKPCLAGTKKTCIKVLNNFLHSFKRNSVCSVYYTGDIQHTVAEEIIVCIGGVSLTEQFLYLCVGHNRNLKYF